MTISDERDPNYQTNSLLRDWTSTPVAVDCGQWRFLSELHKVARTWAEARQAAVEVFASVTADAAARTAAWARLSEAERALLDAVKALTPGPQEPFDPKAHPLVGKRFRLKYERGMLRETGSQCWRARAWPGTIGKVIEVFNDCVRMEMADHRASEPPFTTEWVTAAPPYRMHEIVARFLEDVTPVEDADE